MSQLNDCKNNLLNTTTNYNNNLSTTNKVYVYTVISQGEYETSTIYGIFSTFEKAKERWDKLGSYDSDQIVKSELNEYSDNHDVVWPK